MIRTGRRVAAGGVAALAVVLLAACGNSVSGNAVAGDEPDVTVPVAPTDSSTTTSTGAPDPDSGDKTPPGTSLSVGDSAVVDGKDGDDIGTLGITVTAIEQGDIADLGEFDLDDELKDGTPYYARATFDNIDLADGGNPAISMIAIDSDDERQAPMILFGDFEKCQSGNRSGEEFTPGASYETCMTYMIASGRELAAVEYRKAGTDYSQQPVIWQP